MWIKNKIDMLNYIGRWLIINIDIEFRRGILFVRLIGKLINEANIKLKDELVTLINRSGIYNIVINLENVNEIDKLGLDTIYLLKSLIDKNNGNFILCEIPQNIENQISKINNNLYLYKTQNELTALKALNI